MDKSYCWVEITDDGVIALNKKSVKFLEIEIGIKLLLVRNSGIAFVMGAKGTLIDKA